LRSYWGVEDPAAFVGSGDEQRALFRKIFFELDVRIRIFVSLRLEDIDSMALQKRLDEIGRTQGLNEEIARG
jgi:arsenate reductase